MKKCFTWIVPLSLLSSPGARGGVSSHYFLSSANLADVSQLPGAHLYVVVRGEKKDFLFARVLVDSVDECADDDGNFLGYVLNVDVASSLRFIVSCDDMNAADFETAAFAEIGFGLSPISDGLAKAVDSWILSRTRHLVLHYSDREFLRLVLPVENCSSAFAASVLLQSIAAQFAVSELWGSARIDNPLVCFAVEYLKRHPGFVKDRGVEDVIARLAQCALLDSPKESSALPSVSLEFEPIVPNKILTRHFVARTEECSIAEVLKKTEVAEKRHQEMLKDIAEYLLLQGRQAFQTSSVDLALRKETKLSIFELKSVNEENAISQVSKGLFQLLYYGDALEQCGYSVEEAGLVIEATIPPVAVEHFRRILNDVDVTLRVYDSSKNWPWRLSPPILRPLPRLWSDGEFPWEERFAKYLPVYGFAAACGKFGAGEEVACTGWMDVSHAGLGKLNRNLFIVRAVGRSMEPLIRDGQYCVFEYRKGAFHDNDIVLAQHTPIIDGETEGAFSIKKIVKESATRIVLYPLNADYPPIPLPPNSHDYAIVGTLRKVLRTDARSISAEPPHPHL